MMAARTEKPVQFAIDHMSNGGQAAIERCTVGAWLSGQSTVGSRIKEMDNVEAATEDHTAD